MRWVFVSLVGLSRFVIGYVHPMLEDGAAPTYASLKGKSKMELAKSMHNVGGTASRKGGPKVKAACRRVGLSMDGEKILARNGVGKGGSDASRRRSRSIE